MTIAKVGKKYGITPDTLRYYERIGLISDVPRNKNGIRDYDEKSCKRIEFINHTVMSAFEGVTRPKEYISFLKKRQGVLDAVVFSGGEPLVQDQLAAAMTQVKALGYKIALHTGGYRPDKLAEVLPLVDWVGFEIKTPFIEERYQQGTGSKTPLKNVLTSLDMVISSGKPFECRTTCDPRLLSIEDIYTIARSLQEKGVEEYHLQKYRPIPSDTTSTEADCNKFFQDEALKQFLKDSFKVFDLRS